MLAAESREFTLVNISGVIDLKNVAALCSTFVPHQPGESPAALPSPKPDAYPALDTDDSDQPTNRVEPDGVPNLR